MFEAYVTIQTPGTEVETAVRALFISIRRWISIPLTYDGIMYNVYYSYNSVRVD